MNGHKKVLIVYATAGSGHKKAAEAILLEAKKIYPDARCVDMVDLMGPVMAKIYRDGYIFLIRRLPWLWGFLYFLSDTPALQLVNVTLRKTVNAFACRGFIALILKEAPDCIISTHFTASELVTHAKEKLGFKTKLITVITDYGVHNFWLSSGTDMYCCASAMTCQILVDKGVPSSSIKITGIPLDEKFLKVEGKEALRKEFGLEENLFTALVITGGIGAGPIEEIVELLKDDAQLLVVCGFNKPLQIKLDNKKHPHVRAFGFVDYVQKLMRACDCIVTKAGGLTITEALAMERPMVFFFLIPGQEEINATTISKSEAGAIALSPKKIKEAVLALKNDSQTFSSFSRAAASLAKPHAAAEIVSLVE